MNRNELKSASAALALRRADLAALFGYSWSQVNCWWRGIYPVPQAVALMLTLWLHPAFPKKLRPLRGFTYAQALDAQRGRRATVPEV